MITEMDRDSMRLISSGPEVSPKAGDCTLENSNVSGQGPHLQETERIKDFWSHHVYMKVVGFLDEKGVFGS